MSNITSLEAFRNRQATELQDEKVDLLESLNPPEGNFLIMSVQHQLDYMHHNAMASFNELVKDKQHDFIRLLDFTRSIFRNVFFKVDQVVVATCRNIHYYDPDASEKACDASVQVGITNFETMAAKAASGEDFDEPEFDLRIELRLISLPNPTTNSNVAFEELDFSKVEKLPYQTKAIFRNLLEISKNCGGDTFLAGGGEVFMAQLPYSPAKQCLVIVQASNQLAYCDPN